MAPRGVVAPRGVEPVALSSGEPPEVCGIFGSDSCTGFFCPGVDGASCLSGVAAATGVCTGAAGAGLATALMSGLTAALMGALCSTGAAAAIGAAFGFSALAAATGFAVPVSAAGLAGSEAGSAMGFATAFSGDGLAAAFSTAGAATGAATTATGFAVAFSAAAAGLAGSAGGASDAGAFDALVSGENEAKPAGAFRTPAAAAGLASPSLPGAEALTGGSSEGGGGAGAGAAGAFAMAMGLAAAFGAAAGFSAAAPKSFLRSANVSVAVSAMMSVWHGRAPRSDLGGEGNADVLGPGPARRTRREGEAPLPSVEWT